MHWPNFLPLRYFFVYIFIFIGFINSVTGLLIGQKWHLLRFINLSPESLVFHEPQFFLDKRISIEFESGVVSELSFTEVKQLDPTNNLFHAILFGPSIPSADREKILNYTLCYPAQHVSTLNTSGKVKMVSIDYVKRETGQISKRYRWSCIR